MNLYSIDFNMVGTLYVKAESEAEALAKAKAHVTDSSHEFADDDFVSGKDMDNPDLPDISMSPAVTLSSVIGDSMDLQEENIPTDDEGDDE